MRIIRQFTRTAHFEIAVISAFDFIEIETGDDAAGNFDIRSMRGCASESQCQGSAKQSAGVRTMMVILH